MGKHKKFKNKKQDAPAVSLHAVSDPPFIRQKKFFLVSIFIYALFLYGNTARHGYAFDDSVVITGNQYTKMGFKGIPLLLQKDMFEGIYNQALELGGGRYRPLSLVTFAIEYEFFGENPQVSHIINILLYGFTGIFLFLTLLKLLNNSILPAAVATALFISHPIHTEVVANIKSRDEILAFLFIIAAVYFFIRYVQEKKISAIIISQAFFFLSLLSKETGITFLVLFPMMIYCFMNKSIKDSFTLSIPCWITGILYVAIRTSLVGSPGDRMNTDIMENPFVNSSLNEKLGSISFILFKYLSLLVFPHPLSSDYSYNEIPFIPVIHPKSILSIAVYGAFLYYSIKHLLKRDALSFSFFLFIIPLLLVSNLFFNIGAPMAERFLYLPSLGFCIAVSLLFPKIMKIKNLHTLRMQNPVFFLLLFALLCGFSWKTIQRNKDWKDTETLFAKDVESVPGSAKIHYYYGNILLSDLLKSEAETFNPEQLRLLNLVKYHTLQAVRINPDFHHAHYNLGMVYEKLNMPDSALYHLEKVLSLQPRHLLTQSMIGNVYGKHKKNYIKAIHYLEIAVEHDPNNKQAWDNLGIAYGEINRFDKAIAAFNESLKLDPGNPKTYNNISVTWYKMGDVKKAEEYRQKFLQLSQPPGKNK